LLLAAHVSCCFCRAILPGAARVHLCTRPFLAQPLEFSGPFHAEIMPDHITAFLHFSLLLGSVNLRLIAKISSFFS